MNAERLHETLRLLMNTNGELQIQKHLESVRDHLVALTADPTEPNLQTALANSLASLAGRIYGVRDRISPAQKLVIADIGGHNFFDSKLIDDVRTIIYENVMTPAVARDYVTKLAVERSAYITNIASTHQGLENLGIKGEWLLPGAAELAFLIPRDLFDNHLEELSQELHTINQIIRQFSEVATGHPEPVEVHQISSSEPTFALGLSIAAVCLIGKAVSWLLDAWKKVEEIKKLRQESKKLGYSEEELKSFLDDRITITMDQEIEMRAKEIAERRSEDSGRSNELQAGISWAMRHLMSRIERGMVVEVRFISPPPGAEAAEDTPESEQKSQMYSELKGISQQLQFRIVPGEPILKLPPPDPPMAAPAQTEKS